MGEINWATPAGGLLQKFLASLPTNRPFHLTLYGSAPLQLTVDRQLMSGDVDLFSDDDEDLSALIAASKLDKTHGGFYLEPGEIIEPALARRKQGYGETPPDYKRALGE